MHLASELLQLILMIFLIGWFRRFPSFKSHDFYLAGDLFSEDVADMAVGLLIDVMRRISAADRYVRGQSACGQWDFPLGSK